MSQLLIVIPISFEKSTLEDDFSTLVILLKIHFDFLGFFSMLLSVLSWLFVFFFEFTEC